jgi:hypothetical protein
LHAISLKECCACLHNFRDSVHINFQHHMIILIHILPSNRANPTITGFVNISMERSIRFNHSKHQILIDHSKSHERTTTRFETKCPLPKTNRVTETGRGIWRAITSRCTDWIKRQRTDLAREMASPLEIWWSQNRYAH